MLASSGAILTAATRLALHCFLHLLSPVNLRRATGGTGLGSAICRRIIQGLGRQIWAKSLSKNQGSQFHFTVPIDESSLTE